MTLRDLQIRHQTHVLCGCTTFGTELKLGPKLIRSLRLTCSVDKGVAYTRGGGPVRIFGGYFSVHSLHCATRAVILKRERGLSPSGLKNRLADQKLFFEIEPDMLNISERGTTSQTNPALLCPRRKEFYTFSLFMKPPAKITRLTCFDGSPTYWTVVGVASEHE